MDAQGCLITKVIEEANVEPALKAGIRQTYFTDGEHSQVWAWIMRYREKYDASPAEEALAREFPTYTFLDVPEPYEYYIDCLKDDQRRAVLVEMVDNTIKQLDSNDLDTATKIIVAGMERLHTSVSTGTDEDIVQTSIERHGYYESLDSLAGGIRGIPTGFLTLDRALSGFLSEQLITLVGGQKVGKSTFLILMVMAAHEAGFHPLFVTFEMSNSEQAARFDALSSGVSYNRLTEGKLHPSERKSLRTHMVDVFPSKQPLIFVHDPASTTTVSALGAKITEYQPDIVFVDGVYLMDTDIPGLDAFSAQGLTSITRRMKRLAQQSKIPIVMTTQVLPSKVGRRKGITLDSIGYTSSFAQDSDVILGVQETNNKHERLLRIVAARNAAPTEVYVSWDWERGEMEELSDNFNLGARNASASDDHPID